MNTHRITMLALALAMLATTTPYPQALAAERFSVAQASTDNGWGDEDWRRPKRPRPERPDRPRRPHPGPVILFVPAIAYPMTEREVAPPRDYERPAPRRAQPKAQSRKPIRAAKAPVPKKATPKPTRPATAVQAQAGSYAEGEVLFSAPSPEISETILKRHRLTRLETVQLSLTGATVVRARVAKGGSSVAALRALRADKALLSSELNHLYALQEDGAAAPVGDLAAVQYAPTKMRLPEAHAVADGKAILVAVIDSGIDGSHPELAGTLAPASQSATIDPHGTAIAGVIAAHQRLVSASPKVRILAFDSFLGRQDGTARGSTLDILKSLDKAAAAGARIVNLSFAGPANLMLAKGLDAAGQRGMILIAAAGNGGPKAAPVYPGAHPAVIAVTATDSNDAVYASANRGAYVALAAPGVDILTAAPGATYSQLSGTSFAAAQVTGVAALLLERAPDLSPAALRAILTRTARDLGKPGRDDIFGAGLVDAAAALSALPEATASAALR
ncbi:S8 family serine peptidase [Kaistia defluvii]|uniref:Subtilisin family serine protease n=1 Tax=Kaistia defluvii TaxID=410841 RepID=A0ABV2QT63_9HYPH